MTTPYLKSVEFDVLSQCVGLRIGRNAVELVVAIPYYCVSVDRVISSDDLEACAVSWRRVGRRISVVVSGLTRADSIMRGDLTLVCTCYFEGEDDE